MSARPANDDVLDRQAWVFEGGRVLERPAGRRPALDARRRGARSFGAARRRARGPTTTSELRAQPSAGATAAPVGAVVVAHLHRVAGAAGAAGAHRLAGDRCADPARRAGSRSGVRSAARCVRSRDMTERPRATGARTISSSRFALGPARDELTALAATLDGLLARIAASRRHEQRFASEVAHELRTPLAGDARPSRARAAADAADGAERESALRADLSRRPAD